MKKTILIIYITLVFSLAAAKPNIILVMTDDQGFGDLGSTGNTVFDTPHIDSLGERSAQMSRFYVSPVCSPTRASLMTGRYNYRTKCIDTYKGRSMMTTDEYTLAEALKDGGYATGIFGKWHLGDCYPMRAIDQGFEEALIHNGGGLGQPADPLENKRRYTDPILWHNGKQVQTKGYCTDVYFDAAMAYIEKQVNAKKPFFTYIAPNAPHGPFHDVPEELYQKYLKKDMSAINFGKKLNKGNQDKLARIAAMIENIDMNMGRLWKKLQDLKITENTILIFMVDNGPNGRRYVGNMRGNKTQVHEGGIRSMFYFSWPAELKTGIASDRIAAHIDIMPTLLDAAGVTIKHKDHKFDGKSILPLLRRQKVNWPDRNIVIQTHRGDKPIAFHHFAIIGQRWKLVKPSGFREQPDPKIGFELYDLEKDSKESKNLHDSNPEVAKKLKTDYEAWFKDVSSTRENNYEVPRIIVGTDHEPETMLTLQDARSTGNGWGTDGKWVLKALKKQQYKVTVIRNGGAVEGAAVRLEVNGKKHEKRTDGDRVIFDKIELPAGDFDLRASFYKGEKFVRAWHVILKRK